MAPWVMPPSPTSGDRNLQGYIVDLLNHISRIVPFEYRLHLVKDGEGFGKKKKGREWTGMTRELIKGVSLESEDNHEKLYNSF